MSENPSLPVLDFSDTDRESNAKKLIDIMENLGFLFLANVPGYEEDDLKWCVQFFFDVMPPQKKLSVARKMYNPDSDQVRLLAMP